MSNNFSVTNTQKIHIGSFVRNKMFRIIKFLEGKTLASKWNNIYEKSKQLAGITEPLTTKMYQAIVQKVRDHHNRHKGHVRKKIHDLATGESIEQYFLLTSEHRNSHCLSRLCLKRLFMKQINSLAIGMNIAASFALET
jgi:hypothetical protein